MVCGQCPPYISSTLDYVAAIDKYKSKAGLVKDPELKKEIANYKVIVYTDQAVPTRGQFYDLAQEGKIEFRKIPKSKQ